MAEFLHESRFGRKQRPQLVAFKEVSSRSVAARVKVFVNGASGFEAKLRQIVSAVVSEEDPAAGTEEASQTLDDARKVRRVDGREHEKHRDEV